MGEMCVIHNGGFYLWGKCVIHNGGFYLWGKFNSYGDFTYGANV